MDVQLRLRTVTGHVDVDRESSRIGPDHDTAREEEQAAHLLAVTANAALATLRPGATAFQLAVIGPDGRVIGKEGPTWR